MNNMYVRVKGIVKKEDEYLVLKRWVDDKIPDPFVWEFIDGEINHGESPDDAIKRIVHESMGVDCGISKLIYTWSNMIGDTQCVGIAYLLNVEDEDFNLHEDFGEWAWITRDEFEYYIENRYVLKDLDGVEL